VSPSASKGPSRRQVIQTAGGVAVASALAGSVPFVHAAQSNTIQIALVGCGYRGTGAAEDALSNKSAPTKLVAMADVFANRQKESYKNLTGSAVAKQVDVPEERKFLGFDAYKQAMDCLKPGDVVILTTPPAFRWVHFTYALSKKLNVFMEKPTTVDGPSTRRMLKLAEESEKLGTKVGVGLMCRHSEARKELYKRIKDGAIGDIVLMRAYRQHGPVGSFASPPKPNGITELLYQVQRFHSFLWASGGCFSDFYIHNIDECCWMKDAWPIKAKASGGRHYRGNSIDQNFDTYSVEYTFKDGSKLFLEGRTMPGCDSPFASYAHGTKGSAVISTYSHFPAKCRIFKGQDVTDRKSMTWKVPDDEPNPYRLEWDHLIAAIRDDKPYNEAKRGAEASLVTAMGRMAAHTGQVITLDQVLNHEHELGVGLDQLTMDSDAPLKAGPDSKYPVPNPGKSKREF